MIGNTSSLFDIVFVRSKGIQLVNMEKSNSNILEILDKTRSIHRTEQCTLVLELTVSLYFTDSFRFSLETDSVQYFSYDLF